MILIAIIGITVSIANKKNAAKAKQQRAAAQQREAAGGKPAEWESGDIMIPISAGGQISGVIV